jgi:hypothetical protein
LCLESSCLLNITKIEAAVECPVITSDTDLEVQDDGPYETEGQLGVAVHDVLRPDVDQLNLLVPEEVERHLHVLQHVEPHATSFARLKY